MPVNAGVLSVVNELFAGVARVTIGAVASYVTVLSVDVDAEFAFPAASAAAPAGTLAVTVPSVMPLTATV